MATATEVIRRTRLSDISPVRRISTGIIEILIGVMIFLIFARNLSAETLTTFVMTPGGITVGFTGCPGS